MILVKSKGSNSQTIAGFLRRYKQSKSKARAIHNQYVPEKVSKLRKKRRTINRIERSRKYVLEQKLIRI